MELSGAVEHQGYVTSESRVPLGASDESLLEASANGDQLAFSELYERHARTIYNYLFRRLADWSEAEDLTAVVFLEAFRRRSEVVVVEGKLLREPIYVVKADGSGLRNVTPKPVGAWSPDGSSPLPANATANTGSTS